MANEIINGNNFRLYWIAEGGTPVKVSLETSVSVAISKDSQTVGSKDGDHVTGGSTTVTVTINALWDKGSDASNQFFEVVDALIGDVRVTWEISLNGVAPKVSSTGIFTAANSDSATGGAATWTATLQADAANLVITRPTVV